MYLVFEVNTGEHVDVHNDERIAWSHAAALNDDYAEAMGLNYAVTWIHPNRQEIP